VPINKQGKQSKVTNYQLPDEKGHFGPYGGLFVAETLMESIEELNQA